MSFSLGHLPRGAVVSVALLFAFATQAAPTATRATWSVPAAPRPAVQGTPVKTGRVVAAQPAAPRSTGTVEFGQRRANIGRRSGRGGSYGFADAGLAQFYSEAPFGDLTGSAPDLFAGAPPPAGMFYPPAPGYVHPPRCPLIIQVGKGLENPTRVRIVSGRQNCL